MAAGPHRSHLSFGECARVPTPNTNRTMKLYTVKRAMLGVAFSLSLWSAFFLAVQSNAATNEYPVNKAISGDIKFQVQVKRLKYLGEEVLFHDRFSKVTVAGRDNGSGVWAIECEVKLETTEGGVAANSDQAFNPKWFDLQWKDVQMAVSERCDVVGWRTDGEGVPYQLIGGERNFKGTGELIFTGSSKGKKLKIQFLNAQSVEVDSSARGK